MTLLRRLTPLTLALDLRTVCGTQVVNPVTGRTERTAMDESAEIAQGRQAHQQILKEYGAVSDPQLRAYVNGVGQRLAAQSQRANLQWTPAHSARHPAPGQPVKDVAAG